MIKPTHKGVTAPSRYQEQNDCSVRSIANAKNITYLIRTKLCQNDDNLTSWSTSEVGVFHREFCLSSDDL